MPDRPLTIAAYAAGASLAAVTVVYVFGPTFFFDDEAANSSRSSRKRGVVGLINPANDCFINSILQALAGLPELRLYLIREIHQRSLDGPALYEDLTPFPEELGGKKRDAASQAHVPAWKVLGLQQGLVTAGLKDVLDALNERPIYKKTISAQSFIRVVEDAFRTRISRSQQDAQEFLQVIAERLADEHYAGRRARRRARRTLLGGDEASGVEALNKGEDDKETPTSTTGPEDEAETQTRDLEDSYVDVHVTTAKAAEEDSSERTEDDIDTSPFPFEGKLESQVECSHCHFKPRPAVSSFVSLTLHVPQTNTTLNACFDGLLKVEQIDDFTCDRCRLEHALLLNERYSTRKGLSEEVREELKRERSKLQLALNEDPENPPKDVKLPDLSATPKRRIARHTRISEFPRILAIHLNRSVWDASYSSSKNSAKVAFHETMPLGGLLDRKTYRLLGVVTHKGGHDSGHYESFRRQFLSPPFSTPASMGTEGIYSLRSSPVPSPRMAPTQDTSPPPSPPLQHNDLSALSASRSSSRSTKLPHRPQRRSMQNLPTSVPLDAVPTPGLPTPPPSMDSAIAPKRNSSISSAMGRVRKKAQRGPERWWRISDDKVKECKTSEVLGMQREVYLLFYEMVEESSFEGS